MKIRKRNGSEVTFNRNNIIEAISRANEKVRIDERLTVQEIKDIAKSIEDTCKVSPVAIGYKDIQKMVETAIMKAGKYEVATEYITFRYQKALEERKNTIDDRVLSLLNGENEDIQQENANKNPNIVSTMRDYMAGEVSKDISQRYLIPSDIYDAHKEGIIHFHDMDYFAMPIHNCCLINLDDMLQNGTIISGTQIDKPHTFRNACNIASQIVAQVASSQYGGQTITASHLSKFITVAREYFKKEYPTLNESQIEDLVKKDIRDGVQTLQYQILTLQTTNGQTPFVSVCLYLNEAENEEEKENLALVIEEILKQRIKGVKNENGQYYANPFPKLLYVLEEDNIHEGDKYYYLTKLAAECTTKRMVPDYISEKVMKKLKVSKKGEEGDCYPCMGCRSFLTPYRDPKTKKPKYYGRFNQRSCHNKSS
jgi:ribonucleoside-triphosphate reductase (formate)